MLDYLFPPPPKPTAANVANTNIPLAASLFAAASAMALGAVWVRNMYGENGNKNQSKKDGAYVFLGKRISGRFTVPSGIATVTLDTVKLFADTMPSVGVLTTKSIGPVERAGNREPVFVQVEDERDSWVNAVGLANPGCEEFAEELATLKLPKDKFLLISIFGGTTEEFVKVAKTLEKFADALELNFSCPHAEGFGQSICATPNLAADVVRAIKAVTKKPLIPKLSPNLSHEQLKELVVSLLKAGASGFTAINTYGPFENSCTAAVRDGYKGNVLTIGKGGKSGPIIRDIGLDVVSRLRKILDENDAKSVPIIGMGGIATGADVLAYERAGASIFGVGSALTGMSTAECKLYFEELEDALISRNTVPVEMSSRRKLPPDYMKFSKLTLRSKDMLNIDLGVLYFNEDLRCAPGQFVELWVPGLGEKPFAQAMVNPFTLAVRNVGQLTKFLLTLRPGQPVYVRGPYGNSYTVPDQQTCTDPGSVFVLVGGGTGIAPLLLLAENLSKAGVDRDRLLVYLGGRAKNHIYFQKEFAAHGTVRIATDDGSEGFKGFVTELLGKDLQQLNASGEFSYMFYNCGPEMMMRAAFDIQAKQASVIDIECSIERYMKCGVGICGVCTCDGYRTCVDGPIMNREFLENSQMFGKVHRSKTTKLLEW